MLVKQALVGSAFKGMLGGIGNNFRNFGNAVKDNIGLKWQAVKGVSAPVTNLFRGNGEPAFISRSISKINTATAPARQAVGTAAHATGMAIGTAAHATGNALGTAGNYIKDVTGRGVSAIQHSRAMGAINRGVFQRASNGIRNLGIRFTNYVNGTLGNEVANLTNQAEQALRNPVYAGLHMGNADTIRRMAAGVSGDMINGMATPYRMISNGFNRLATGFSNIGNRLNGVHNV